MNKGSNFWFKCLKPNCHSTFETQGKLDLHMRIHNNQLDVCQYCPYRYVRHYEFHLNKHFRIKEHTCDVCGLMFWTKTDMRQHSSKHEGITYSCLICKIYEARRKNTMQVHLREKHADFLGNNINWETVKKYVKLN